MIPEMMLLKKFNQKPPTLYLILQSIVNYGKEYDETTKIKDLAKYGRSTVFDFDYPLSTKISKEDFECMILNKFLMRRIGFETFTAFQIQLNVKLNEIMPRYNKMFDFLDGWNLFEDGESIQRTLNKDSVIDFDGIKDNTGTNRIDKTGTDTITNTGTNTNLGTNISDLRHSNLPQNEIENIQNANYLTDYNYNNDSINNTETLNTQNQRTVNLTDNNTKNLKEVNNNTTAEDSTITETITKTPKDKLKLYSDFIEQKNNIFSMIFSDLSCLFYGLL